MKIDNIAQLTAPKAPRESARNETAPAAKTEAAEASADVSLLRQPGTDNSQDIDSVRVEELRQAIAEGRLEIRADKIADGLIKSVRELVES
ncbi:flagellar biosynthesis anti-sigma factor FlgM [Microbulbifer thermotolerans]|uniref:Negative regulator of flagellin synthesis n=1 Tax=Microbulbifer thermotolerans TaxID=252514 RepID=A0AB35HY12_MICTH|nr:flagellar biosynthesis anti-sigma factor FlgM [Microbulbifer thermotolerans]MCX2780099.1 flagellar biosynthesis anti-sigma factor FlgM [Microbulbifer thermotolerans]MCX2802125.1 flagellar biosynthesis anti-sigma factor FlgM [Microbulbifer thermotolerans]MCX2805523.1 flagellar biosynthesis anti-sigma factor FlgM [Microbulbifer thermotolerans]MCX2831950.1 flagellar biosynthesis anti-sigma factor FlgM [Microbulbifer thermotolerans]MCX2842485.1 flagellar biosynthesis anti-sigma factor FlgM [Mic